jgi:hypothetical protein
VDTLTSLITAGGIGTILAGIITLVRIALSAERRRADDWRTAAQTSAAANAILGGQVEKLIASVEHLATTQREMMALLQKVAAAERGKAA